MAAPFSPRTPGWRRVSAAALGRFRRVAARRVVLWLAGPSGLLVDARSDREFVRELYLRVLGREPDPAGFAYCMRALESEDRLHLTAEVAQAPEARLALPDPVGQEDFLRHLYREVLGRDADPAGMRWLSGLLAAGASRQRVTVVLATSEEARNRAAADAASLPDLRKLRPAAYRTVAADDGHPVDVVNMASPADFDWLEAAILDNGYYEKPGVWTLGLDADKRRMAALLSHFRPGSALELGCAAGAVLAALHDLDIRADGVEISDMAVRRAPPDVRPRIHVGDLLTLELPRRYQLVFGLDVFEHFNPNRLDAYLARVAAVTEPGGFVFANVPAFGPDRVWGQVFDAFLPQWREDAARGRPFRVLQVDRDGYPMHGHLIWADSVWWETRFTAAGLRREPEVERALHGRYDAAFAAESPARRAFFVFSRDAPESVLREVIDRAVYGGFPSPTPPDPHSSA